MKLIPTKRTAPRGRRKIDEIVPLIVDEWVHEGDKITVTVRDLEGGIGTDRTPLRAAHIVAFVVDEVEDA